MRINKIKMDGGIPAPRLINARFSTGFRFAGTRNNQLNDDVEITDKDTLDTNDRIDGANLPNLLEGFSSNSNTKKSNTSNLWSTTASFSFAYNNANPNNSQKTCYLTIDRQIFF